MEEEANIFSLGYDTNLSRNDLSAALPDFQIIETPSASSGGGYSGGITDFTNQVSSPQNLQTGTLTSSLEQAVGALFSGKTSFTDTTNGYRMGIDPSDNLFKFVMGTTGSMIDWNVTSANTLTITGAITASTGIIGGFTIGSTTLSATNLTLTSGAANTANISVGSGTNTAGINSPNSATDIAFWAGDTFANRATAPLRIYASGVSFGINRISTITTPVTVTNTAVETDLINVSVPANTLGTTGSIKISAFINVTKNGGGDTLTFVLYYGSTAIATSAAVAPPNASTFGFMDCIVSATGATNTQLGGMVLFLSASGTGASLNQACFQGSGTAAEDSTGALNIRLTATWQNANANDEVVLKNAIIEKVV